MSDNSSEEKESKKQLGIEENDVKEINTLVKVIKEIEKEEKKTGIKNA